VTLGTLAPCNANAMQMQQIYGVTMADIDNALRKRWSPIWAR